MTDPSIPDFSHLPPRVRAEKYRQFAQDARIKAGQCMGPIQETLIRQAGKLEQLAREADVEAEETSIEKSRAPR